ncbi:D-lyxose/D-mannose family sugar isomerase [Pseudoroseicyclus aestuarii]|uniref:D-lyxose ketol-isomerase n=1 Tax=Pseudoroseicyclus aestuarii TaxID=1795041 RepID=A0A318SZ25_9RHOB|nr:D-lyxose/D-mannose family sugar isomerase [Pseudoroseicyclus aestuarii]PYE85656.1 hypothetical protein DFP88_101325 [Pseudoroseicyclus aestuarii]
MRRSRINTVMAEAAEVVRSQGLHLPPWAWWSPAEFMARRDSARGVIEAGCGWEVTDYGTGDFDRSGLVLFTLRNVTPADRAQGTGYAERLLVSRQDQLSPMRSHTHGAGDIINRGGAALVVELYGSDDRGGFAKGRGGRVLRDGIACDFAPGDRIRLQPGESLTLRPGDWHAFWGEGGSVLIGTVSTAGDTAGDTLFRDEIGPFGPVEEDASPEHLLVSDYRSWLG